MKIILITLSVLAAPFFCRAIPLDTLLLKRTEAETIFLRENLLLAAERLSITQAEALVIQARAWPNPSLTFDQVNLWATERQLAGNDPLPPFAGTFGRNQQFALQLEQLIQTAGKRRKLIAMERVSTDMAKQYFQELLRDLKIEFRNNLTELQFLQQQRAVYLRQHAAVVSLLDAYNHQAAQGNLARADYIRLQALQLEIAEGLNKIQLSSHAVQQELKILMNLNPASVLVISPEGFVPAEDRFQHLQYDVLLAQALDNRPDLKVKELEKQYATNMYAYQRAQRVPDLTFITSYDRGSSFMLDFVGFGVGLDLPVFNRNRGNIAHARAGVERSQTLATEAINRAQAEVTHAWQNLEQTNHLYNTIDPTFEGELDGLLDRYTHNFRARNLSMLEYLDFQETYIKNKMILIGLRKDLHQQFETLQYLTGKEIE